MNNILFKRIRNKHGNPRGILLAKSLDDSTVGIGWSLCSARDNFDVDMGKLIANGRTLAFNAGTLPHSIHDDFRKFAKRCQLYFKGQTIVGINAIGKDRT